MTQKVLVADPLSESSLKTMRDAGLMVDVKPGLTEDGLVAIIGEYDALIVRSGVKVTKKVLEAGKKLKMVGRAGVGVDNIDTTAAAELGICVENTPLGNTNAAAEHTIALMIILSKHIIHSNQSMKDGKWDRKNFDGTELKGKVLGLIGFGNVGKKVARVALALDMQVHVYDPFVSKEAVQQLGLVKSELADIFKTVDYLTVHVPMTPETKNMISDNAFAQMKTGVRILNVARGGVIDEEALLRALESGKVAAAGLDVYSTEPPINRKLIENEKVVCTPHLGASTREAQENVGREIAEQTLIALTEGKIIHCVNKITVLRK